MYVHESRSPEPVMLQVCILNQSDASIALLHSVCGTITTLLAAL